MPCHCHAPLASTMPPSLKPAKDADDDDFRIQALPVSDAPVSLDGPPTSAEEYLRRVRCEHADMSITRRCRWHSCSR